MQLLRKRKASGKGLRLELFGILADERSAGKMQIREKTEKFLGEIAYNNPALRAALGSEKRNAIVSAFADLKEKRGVIPETAIRHLLPIVKKNPARYIGKPDQLLRDAIAVHIRPSAEHREQLIDELAKHKLVFNILDDLESRHYWIKKIAKEIREEE